MAKTCGPEGLLLYIVFEVYQRLSVEEKIPISRKPIQRAVQSASGRIGFRIGFRNNKKSTVLLAFSLVRKSIIGLNIL